MSVKLTTKWTELEYEPSAGERDILETNIGGLVRVVVRGEHVVAVYI